MDSEPQRKKLVANHEFIREAAKILVRSKVFCYAPLGLLQTNIYFMIFSNYDIIISGVQRFFNARGQTPILEKISLILPKFLMTFFLSHLPQNFYLHMLRKILIACADNF